MTRNAPVCSQTKMRPSGATAIAVAPVIPAATSFSEKPSGNSAMLAGMGGTERASRGVRLVESGPCGVAPDPHSKNQARRPNAKAAHFRTTRLPICVKAFRSLRCRVRLRGCS